MKVHPMLKTCPFCATQFTTTERNRKYCSLRCRGAQGRKNERARDMPQALAPSELDRYFVPPILFPTEETIRKAATAMVLMETSKPTMFRGPDLKEIEGLPANITFGPTLVPNEWLMFYEKPVFAVAH